MLLPRQPSEALKRDYLSFWWTKTIENRPIEIFNPWFSFLTHLLRICCFTNSGRDLWDQFFSFENEIEQAHSHKTRPRPKAVSAFETETETTRSQFCFETETETRKLLMVQTELRPEYVQFSRPRLLETGYRCRDQGRDGESHLSLNSGLMAFHKPYIA